MRQGGRSLTGHALGGLAPDRQRLALAFAALVVGAVAMGASPLFVRLADVGPYASAFWRTALALPFLWLWSALEAKSARAAWRGLDCIVLLCGCFFAGDLFFWHLSIMSTSVANATFLATTAPVWVALGAWLVLGERVGTRILLGLALCILGGAALLGQSYGYAPERLSGDLFGVITATFFGGYMLAVRAARGRLGAGRLAFLSTAVTALCLLLIAVTLEPVLLPRSLAGATALLALAVVSQVGGQGLLAVALGTLPATFSSLVIFIEAIAAACLAWIFLGEALGWTQALGGILILVGIWLARPRAAKAAGITPGVAL
jgi:drug/metabolite transporter (DMT)-like permease